MSRRLLLLALTLPGAACGLSEERFATAYYREACAHAFDCAPDEMASLHDSVDGCVAGFEPEIEDLLSTYEACDFAEDAARECLDSVDALTCDEEPSFAPCAGVWAC